MNVNPSIIAATIAGGGIGTAAGILTKGEQLEEARASEAEMLFKPIGTGMKTGLIGAGIGAGASGTAVVLANILRRR